MSSSSSSSSSAQVERGPEYYAKFTRKRKLPRVEASSSSSRSAQVSYGLDSNGNELGPLTEMKYEAPPLKVKRKKLKSTPWIRKLPSKSEVHKPAPEVIDLVSDDDDKDDEIEVAPSSALLPEDDEFDAASSSTLLASDDDDVSDTSMVACLSDNEPMSESDEIKFRTIDGVSYPVITQMRYFSEETHHMQPTETYSDYIRQFIWGEREAQPEGPFNMDVSWGQLLSHNIAYQSIHTAREGEHMNFRELAHATNRLPAYNADQRMIKQFISVSHRLLDEGFFLEKVFRHKRMMIDFFFHFGFTNNMPKEVTFIIMDYSLFADWKEYAGNWYQAFFEKVYLQKIKNDNFARTRLSAYIRSFNQILELN